MPREINGRNQPIMFNHFNCKGCGADCIGMPHDPEHVQQGYCSQLCAGGERKVYARAALRVHLREAGNDVPDCSVHLWRVDEACDECRRTLLPFAPQVRAAQGFASIPLNLGELRVVVEEPAADNGSGYIIPPSYEIGGDIKINSRAAALLGRLQSSRAPQDEEGEN
jgi:hypothetical protein